MNEHQKYALKAVVAAVISLLSAAFDLSPEWSSPYFIDLVVSAVSGVVAVFYAGKRIVEKPAA